VQTDGRRGYAERATVTSSAADKTTSAGEQAKEDPETVIVTFRGVRIQAKRGSRLRDVLLQQQHSAETAPGSAVDLSPYNGKAKLLNCRGFGTCGTCAVAVVRGSVSPVALEGREMLRLGLPPHSRDNTAQKGLRLSCQIALVEDIEIVKYGGGWGQDAAEQPY
jgi:ferredoxin